MIGDLKRLSQARKVRPIRRVIQPNGTSCGLACVAMLTRLPFRDILRCAKELWEPGAWDAAHYTDAADLRCILKALGWRMGREVPGTDFSKVPHGSIAAIHKRERSNGHTYWHWVVVVHGRGGLPEVLDPRASVKAARRTDLKGIRLHAYHKVSSS